MRHNMSNTPVYNAWRSMKTRCYYGGYRCHDSYINISVCDEWLHDFMAFYKYIGNKPSPEHSLDRIDNSKDYEPGNVRWATEHEQQANRSNNNPVVGVSFYTAENKWSAELTIKGVRVFHRRFKDYNDAVVARRAAEAKYRQEKKGELK